MPSDDVGYQAGGIECTIWERRGAGMVLVQEQGGHGLGAQLCIGVVLSLKQ